MSYSVGARIDPCATPYFSLCGLLRCPLAGIGRKRSMHDKLHHEGGIFAGNESISVVTNEGLCATPCHRPRSSQGRQLYILGGCEKLVQYLASVWQLGRLLIVIRHTKTS